jgi:hypothetical protein
MASALTAWIAVTLWFMVASWTYKDNVLFKVATVASVAGGAANGLLVNFNGVWQKAVLPVLDGSKVWLIIPIILGIMLAGVFDTRYAWLARFPTVLMMGVSIGAMITGVMSAQILGQIGDTVSGLSTASGLALINQLLILVGVVCSILYFTYSKEHTGVLGSVTRIGRYFLLASLGPYWAGELGFHMAFGISFVQIILDALRTIIPF